ncbi:hypothetical protein SKAU_G00184480 [Synaphobranchus kaupii]|uniref:Sec39 domain-containing protein n=1 Tax=Synaphobranchus kaupii TaxID=118154 RepID=A0A9Q1FCG2_SYNKA|nr:hypothetical protein SKAU_G00184480 [Synaphobranchus kaupii]
MSPPENVAEVLEKHGLQKPISYVRNSQSSREEAYQLMVKLTRHTGRKNPPVSETLWKGLLQDPPGHAAERLHLPGARHLPSDLHGEPAVLESSGEHSAGGSDDASVELVLASAREYFNSSTSLTDDCMILARSCLQLISDCPTEIQEELDLINALSQLEEFGVKILPLQVRLRTDRLTLMEECIRECPTAYKQSTVLLGLAGLLRVAGDDEPKRKGQVLTLLAEQALQCQNYKASYIHCQDLMATGYGAGWHVCCQLGQCEGYQDLLARQELMAFALTHCPPASIQSLLASSSSLQTQILYQAVNYQIDADPAQVGDGRGRTTVASDEVVQQADAGAVSGRHSADLLKRTTAKTMKVISNTTMTTRAVLHAVSDSQWWKTSVNYLRPLHGQGPGSALKGQSGENVDLEKQGCNPFYEALFDNPYIDEKEDMYTSYDHVPLENFAEVLLRTGKLAETKSEGQNLFPTTEVLIQLASDALPKDMTLALAYLLALPQVLDANKCFEKQSHSALSLQLAAYYYALQIYARLAPCLKDKCHPLYRADPRDLIALVTQHVTHCREADRPEELERLIAELQLYNERLTDFTQAQVLRGLGRGVDVQRFSADKKYKKETILGLAETLEENVYKISLSLAQRYGVPLWEVYMTHLEFLFTDSGLSTKDIERRTEALGLFETLRSDPGAFYDHMTKYVYPSIAGTDLLRLLYYFTLLEACGCAELVHTAIKPETHIKLLKKLKAVATGLNYRKLTDEDSDPLLALEPVLTSQNVLSISKLTARLPLRQGEALSSSAVHAAWLNKLFWKGDPQVLKKRPQTDAEFLHAYDACAKYLDRLFPADAVSFLDAVTFSAEAAELITSPLSVIHLSPTPFSFALSWRSDTRLEVTKRALRAVRQLSEKRKKKGGDEARPPRRELPRQLRRGPRTPPAVAGTPGDARSHPFVLSLKNSEQDLLQEYSRLYDLSRSDGEKIHDLAVAMLMDGQPLDRVQQLLAVAVGPFRIFPKNVVQDAIERIVQALSGDEHALADGRDPLAVLEGVIASVHSDVQNGGGALSSDDVLAWLRPFCGDTALPVRVRMEVLQILEQAFHLGEQDSRLLVLYRSQAVLKACWPDRQLEMGDIENEGKRDGLFAELLGSSAKWEEMQHLMLLLQAWPPLTGGDTAASSENPWVRLTAAIMALGASDGGSGGPGVDVGGEVLSMCRSLQPTKHKLPIECVRLISGLLLEQAGLQLPALKLMVESADGQLQTLALDQIRGVNKVDESNCDDELLALLLDGGLLLGCVGTALYPRLVEHLLAHHQERGWDVEEMCREMSAAGRPAEAGSLLLAHRGTHRGQVTFNSALAVVRRWL